MMEPETNSTYYGAFDGLRPPMDLSPTIIRPAGSNAVTTSRQVSSRTGLWSGPRRLPSARRLAM